MNVLSDEACLQLRPAVGLSASDLIVIRAQAQFVWQAQSDGGLISEQKSPKYRGILG